MNYVSNVPRTSKTVVFSAEGAPFSHSCVVRRVTVPLRRRHYGQQSRMISQTYLVGIVDVTDEHLNPFFVVVCSPRGSKIRQNRTDVDKIRVVEVLDTVTEERALRGGGERGEGQREMSKIKNVAPVTVIKRTRARSTFWRGLKKVGNNAIRYISKNLITSAPYHRMSNARNQNLTWSL